MKKLMFIITAVAMTAVVQAASVSWTCTNVKDGDGNTISGIAFFVNAATLSQEAFMALDGATAFNTALSGMYSYTPSTAGKYSTAESVANATLGIPDANEGNNAYLAIFDTATITDSSNYYLTEVKTFNSYEGTSVANVKWGSQSTPSQAAGAWHSVSGSSPIPEPTSALLLVGGLVALGLRRRRR